MNIKKKNYFQLSLLALITTFRAFPAIWQVFIDNTFIVQVFIPAGVQGNNNLHSQNHHHFQQQKSIYI